MRIRQALVLLLLAALWGSVAANAGMSVRAVASSKTPALPKLHFTAILRWVGSDSSGTSNWELDVENTNLTEFINDFTWVPPAGLEIKAITDSEGGKCTLSNGQIFCSGNIAPESCSTCEGGALTIDFTGTGFEPIRVQTDYGGFWVDQGWTTGLTTVTKVSSGFADLPLCAKGQTSTKSKPCAKS